MGDNTTTCSALTHAPDLKTHHPDVYISQDTTVDIEELLPRIPMPASDTLENTDVGETSRRTRDSSVVPGRVVGGVTCTRHVKDTGTEQKKQTDPGLSQRVSSSYVRLAFAPSWNAQHINGLYYEVIEMKCIESG